MEDEEHFTAEFSANKGWFNKGKKRPEIHLVVKQGKSASTDIQGSMNICL
jgi:hypothetical protein